MNVVPIPGKATHLVDGYEGLSGQRGLFYYPYHGHADKPGVWTIGRGHLLTPEDIATDRFRHGLTLQEVDELFAQDCQPRANALDAILRHYTEDQFAGAFSSFYNLMSIWTLGTPGEDHRAGKFTEAAQALLLYTMSNGKHQLGLWRRRMSEALCYLTGEVLIVSDERTEALLEQRLGALLTIRRPSFT